MGGSQSHQETGRGDDGAAREETEVKRLERNLRVKMSQDLR